MLALGAAFRHAEEEMFGQQLHTALQNQCNSSEKILIPFRVKWLQIPNHLLRASVLILGGKSHLSQT